MERMLERILERIRESYTTWLGFDLEICCPLSIMQLHAVTIVHVC
jgi:hypothetical protein